MPDPETFYRGIIQGMRCGILAVDRRGRLAMANALAVQILELEEGRAVLQMRNVRKVQNHIGGVHATATALLAETERVLAPTGSLALFGGLALGETLAFGLTVRSRKDRPAKDEIRRRVREARPTRPAPISRPSTTR